MQRNFQPPLLHIHGKAPGHTECEQRSLCNGARLWGFVCSRTSCGQAASPYCSSSRLGTRHAPLSLARNKPSVVTNRGYADTNKKKRFLSNTHNALALSGGPIVPHLFVLLKSPRGKRISKAPHIRGKVLLSNDYERLVCLQLHNIHSPPVRCTWQHAAAALLLNARYRKRHRVGIDEGKQLVMPLTMGR